MSPFSNTSLTYALPKRLYTACELLLGGLLLLLAGLLLPGIVVTPTNWLAAYGIYLCIGVLTLVYWPYGALGWANRVTLLRAVLVTLVASGLISSAFIDELWKWLLLAVAALLLDGIDGWVARFTRSHSTFGARFDMELDALLIMLLCIGLWQLEPLGFWVLLVGAMRYLFVVASWPFPWLSRPLFESFRRKAVCVWQVAALLLALTPLTPHLWASLLAVSALISLIYSFGFDVWWLYRHKQA